MRYYKLTIDGAPATTAKGVDSAKWVFSSNAKSSSFFGLFKSINATPLQIEFCIRSFTSAATSVPAIIKLHNLPKQAYQMLQALAQDKPRVILEAGWNDEYIMSKKLGYEKITNQQILVGNIQNVMGNFMPLDNYIIITTALAEPLEDMIEYANEAAGEQVKDGFIAQFNQQEKIASKIEEYINNLVGEGVKVILSSFVKSQIAETMKSFNYSNLWTFLSGLTFTFGLNYLFDSSTQKLGLFKDKDNDDKATLDFNNNEVKLVAADLITQPEALGYSNQISVVTRLRPDIKLGSKIQIGKVQTRLGAAIQAATFSAEGIKDLNILNQGKYDVINVMHNGNFYGTSPDSWSTQMLLQPSLSSSGGL